MVAHQLVFVCDADCRLVLFVSFSTQGAEESLSSICKQFIRWMMYGTSVPSFSYIYTYAQQTIVQIGRGMTIITTFEPN